MMSQRPQPVTSKFRQYYSNNIYPVYVDSNLYSSSDSTSSLISVLHHDSFEDNSLDSDFKDYLKIEDNKEDVCSVSSGGLFCKRIIARQPQYPGARVTIVKHIGTVNNLAEHPQTKRKISNKGKETIIKSTVNKTVVKTSILNKDNIVEDKKIVRKIGTKSRSVSEKSNSRQTNMILKHKSDDSYSSNDFSSISDVIVDENISKRDPINDIEVSTTPGSVSLSINDQAKACDERNHRDNGNIILTAFEAWYLKKEKEKRKKQETESLKEKEKLEKENEEKIKRKEICHEKIKKWLTKKEERQKKELENIQKQKEKENNEKEKKKVELIEKSSKKYVEWKLEKKKRKRMLEKEKHEFKIKEDAEKMIKQAKAANAFQRWFEEHKDHQMPVPYSYGISDGKLTSYYDKTSNPPPSFFNPDPWKPLIDIKN